MHGKQIVRCQTAFLNQSLHKSAATLCKRFVLLFVLALGCAQVPVEDLRQTIPPETAQLVSTVTSGTVSSEDIVKVRFVEPAIDTSLVGHTLKKQVFTFTPPIDGIAQWKTTQALVFRPNRPLSMRQPYQGRLDLAVLLPARADLQPLHFNFAVAGREILSLEGDFDLKTANDPRYLIYQGRLELTEKTAVQKVREAATLRLSSGRSLRRGETLLPLTWQADATGKVFTFTSAVIERDTTQQSYALIVDDATLEILPPIRKGHPPRSDSGHALAGNKKGRRGRLPSPDPDLFRRIGPATAYRRADPGAARSAGSPEGHGQADPRRWRFLPRPDLRVASPRRHPQPLGHSHRGSHAPRGRFRRPQTAVALCPRRHVPAVVQRQAPALCHPQCAPRRAGGEKGLCLQLRAVFADRALAQRQRAARFLPRLLCAPRRRAGSPRHARNIRPAQHVVGTQNWTSAL